MPGSCNSKLEAAFPSEISTAHTISRPPVQLSTAPPNITADFGPHVFLDLAEYAGPQSLDDLFTLFDRLPWEIDMTPIMRPYLLKGETVDGRRFVSVVTMIAESHIILHLFPDERRAFFDLFSCRFFDSDKVLARLKLLLPGEVLNETMIGRGGNYRLLRTELADEIAKSQHWLNAMRGTGAR